jgi:hypothetical protein
MIASIGAHDPGGNVTWKEVKADPITGELEEA